MNESHRSVGRRPLGRLEWLCLRVACEARERACVRACGRALLCIALRCGTLRCVACNCSYGAQWRAKCASLCAAASVNTCAHCAPQAVRRTVEWLKAVLVARPTPSDHAGALTPDDDAAPNSVVVRPAAPCAWVDAPDVADGTTPHDAARERDCAANGGWFRAYARGAHKMNAYIAGFECCGAQFSAVRSPSRAKEGPLSAAMKKLEEAKKKRQLKAAKSSTEAEVTMTRDASEAERKKDSEARFQAEDAAKKKQEAEAAKKEAEEAATVKKQEAEAAKKEAEEAAKKKQEAEAAKKFQAEEAAKKKQDLRAPTEQGAGGSEDDHAEILRE